MQSKASRPNIRRPAAILVMVAAAALAGCQQKSAGLGSIDSMTTASTVPANYEQTTELAKKWQSDTKNLKKGMAYANALDSIGQTQKQLEVLSVLYKSHPDNPQVTALYGKKLLASGRSNEAVVVLETATMLNNKDWRSYSALGSAYDQQGIYDKARTAYQQALTIEPDNLTVLNNLGMSFALQGDLKEAEKTLRMADALPKAASEPRIRQNLALVVGLQGRFEEASAIASKDLPPQQVEANMAYLKTMLSQPNTWQQLQEG